MDIDLGCGPTPRDGFTGVDILEGPGIITYDLTQTPWTCFEDSCARFVLAHDILEHLVDKNATMAEIERILMPGGRVDILVPSTDGRGAWQDPTHVSYWNINTFAYYAQDYMAYLQLNQRYGYQGNGFKIVKVQNETITGSLPEVVHVHAVLERPRG